MTTAIAYVAPGGAWMAADTTTNVYDRPVASAEKIRLLTADDGQEMLLAFAGEGAGPNVVANHLTVESIPTDASQLDAWANTIAEAITELYLERSMVDGQRMDGTVLLAVPGRLWTLTHHQAIAHTDGMAAIGSGEGPALGALHALIGSGKTVSEAIIRACEIGILLDRYSGGPVELQSISRQT